LASDAHLVIVNTPVGTHFEYAKSAVGGKTCLSRKAFTTTVAEAENWLLTRKRSETLFSKTGDGTVILKQCARFF
jgi:predicted dehydrogenase